MYQVLYRKWRPQVFADVVGQPHVTSTLLHELQAGRLAHAYLFTGSRGTGKTTCAKILAKAVNCLHPVDGDPCNECANCKGIDSGAILDVIEIDAASNNGVDNIRDLREEANFTPATAKYRVYIIDEVHMLSIGAFNALLKTLEEPPEHVMFILATTEVHKLPATILSRCQRFDFRRIPPEDIAARLSYVAGQEGLSLTDEAALLIARLADGALRDALSLLDQCAGRSREITADTVGVAAGLTGRDYLFTLSDAVLAKDSAAALAILDELHNGSCDMERLCSELTGHFRNLMLAKTMKNPAELLVVTPQELARIGEQAASFSLETVLYALDLLQQTLAHMRAGADRRIEMEMTLIRLCTPKLAADGPALLRRIAELEAALRTGSVSAPVKRAEQPAAAREAAPQSPVPEPEKKTTPPEPEAPPVDALPEPVPPPLEDDGPAAKLEPARSGGDPQPEADAQGDVPFAQWPEVLEELGRLNKPLKGVLNGSSAFLHGEFILIQSQNPMLDQFIRQSANAGAVKEAVLRVSGQKYRLGIYRNASAQKAPAKKKDPLEDLIGRMEQNGVPYQIE